ncbi:MAG: hypothetical protein U7127_05890 [Phormidium sp.]
MNPSLTTGKQKVLLHVRPNQLLADFPLLLNDYLLTNHTNCYAQEKDIIADVNLLVRIWVAIAQTYSVHFCQILHYF